jgi:predicted HD phosphohydrolase
LVAFKGSEDPSLDGIPGFAQGSRLLEEAYELAADAHHGARRRSDTNIEHPVEVGRLLHDEGFDDEVVAAALLHDVVEDTDTDLGEIGDRFGPRVAELVCVMTEDASIERFEQRKAEHRARVADHSSRAAVIYAADKLAKTRALHHDDGGPLSDARLDHYRQTLIELREAYPELPFLEELADALRALDADREQVGRR